MERFTMRNNLYDQICKKTSIKKPEKSKIMSKQGIRFPGQFQTVERHHLAACLPFKTGSTSWEHLLWKLENPGKIMSNHTHKMLWTILSNKVRFETLEKKLDVFNARERSSFTRFLTVRHPLTRLYSGWNEHLELKVDEKKGGLRVRGPQAKMFGILEKDWTETHACTWWVF